MHRRVAVRHGDRRDRTFPVRSLVAILLVLTACHHGTSAGDAGIPCKDSSDCQGGLVCISGVCTNCNSDAQCSPTKQCDPTQLVCVFRAGWGDQCKLNSDCQAGDVCHQGLCISQGSVTLCLNPDNPQACPPGQTCNATNMVCEQNLGCFADTDCSAGEVCNLGTHQCEEACTAQDVSTVCAVGFKCVKSHCVQCTQNSDCPVGFNCNTAAGRCVTQGECFTNNDCTVPDICNCLTGTCTPPPPPCTSDEDCCRPAYACDVASGQCLASTCQPDQYDPQDLAISTAPVVTAGTISGLTLCTQFFDGGSDQPADYFAVDLNAGDALDVVVDTDVLVQDSMDIRIIDAKQQVYSEGQLATEATVSLQGTYYVRVTSTDAWVPYSLRLIITQEQVCPSDIYEPNNTIAQATIVPPTTEQLPPQGILTVCPGQGDYYELSTPAAGQSAEFQVFFVAGQPELDLYVYDTDGMTLIGQSTSSSPPQSVIVSPSQVTGSHFYCEVVAADPRAQNQYYLQVTYQ
jgi:Cys-rich repeat protein